MHIIIIIIIARRDVTFAGYRDLQTLFFWIKQESRNVYRKSGIANHKGMVIWDNIYNIQAQTGTVSLSAKYSSFHWTKLHPSSN